MIESRTEIGSTFALSKDAFDQLLKNLHALGYETIGPRQEQGNLVYDRIDSLADLPHGYITEQAPGRYRLVKTNRDRYFDIIPGAHSWKQFLFPSRSELFQLKRDGSDWKTQLPETAQPKYAFIGVRGCEQAAIQIQDNIFIRPDFSDPVYHTRRKNLFILAVNCMAPSETCFCSSLKTGPGTSKGFDLSLTELDDVFLLEIGSELGRSALNGLPVSSASAFLLQSAEKGLERAAQQTRHLDTSNLPGLLLENLNHPHWNEIAKRCLSCGNCTQVCPTCFCWDVVDTNDLSGDLTRREKVWDSCFNPGFSYQAGGNTRPTIHSRYRQWLSHKLGSWVEQNGTLGCVGCGRCISWCPPGIDLTAEIPAFRKGSTK
jgi:ferredoxin